MLDKNTLLELQAYIDQHKEIVFYSLNESLKYNLDEIKIDEIEDFVKKKRQPTFSDVLFKMIDKRGQTDSYIYNKAGIDRRHFSKIRKEDYRVSKNTAIALALALELSNRETEKLLSAAGFTLSDNDTFDLVIQFCLEKKIYDLLLVNEALDYFSLRPLLSKSITK
ncbi:hypothetical protein IM538_11600 [Cytobacillus suaedae]|nr:hypothetical protein IM538_11600 [Cytobacillus suaedae]